MQEEISIINNMEAILDLVLIINKKEDYAIEKVYENEKGFWSDVVYSECNGYDGFDLMYITLKLIDDKWFEWPNGEFQ